MSDWRTKLEMNVEPACDFDSSTNVIAREIALGILAQLEEKNARLLAVVRAAYTYDYCNDDDVLRKKRLLLELRVKLAAVEDLLLQIGAG